MAKSAIQRAKDSASRLRKKGKERKGFAVRKVAMGASAYGIGKLDAGFDVFGMSIQVPTILGMPKSATLAAVGYVVSLMSGFDSLAGNIGEGAGDAGASIALFQTGRGETVSGYDDENEDVGQDDADLQSLVDEVDELSEMAAAAEGVSDAEAEVLDEEV